MRTILLLIFVCFISCQSNDRSNKNGDTLSKNRELNSEYDSIFEDMDKNYIKDEDGFILQGLTSDMKDSTVIHLCDANTELSIDSTYVLNNKFQFKGKVNGYRLIDVVGKDYSQWKPIWVQNTKMIFDTRGTIFKKAKVLGSDLQQQDNEWFYAVEILDIENDSIEDIMKVTPWSNLFRKISLGIKLTSYHIKIPRANKTFIKSHPDYLVSAYALTYLMHNINTKETQRLYNALSKNVQESEYGERIRFFLANKNKLEIGDKAVDFTLPSTANTNVKLSSFNGRYVLLEFWSSNCGPCRMENPNLLRAYKKYNNKGFEILSVSLDKDETTWKNTIEEYNMIWTNVSDLKGQFGDVVLIYNVESIPKNYLIDPNGIIIYKDLRGDDLQKVLEKLFN